MKTLIRRLGRRFGRKAIEHEVEEEFAFHLESLRAEHMRQGMSAAEAQAATRKRFGDLERVKKQCVEISSRSHPLRRALKSFLIMVLLAGVLTRVLSADVHLSKVGEMLMAVAILSRLLLYARSLRPSGFSSQRQNSFAGEPY